MVPSDGWNYLGITETFDKCLVLTITQGYTNFIWNDPKYIWDEEWHHMCLGFSDLIPTNGQKCTNYCWEYASLSCCKIGFQSFYFLRYPKYGYYHSSKETFHIFRTKDDLTL